MSKLPENPPSNIGDLEINDSEEEDSRDSHFRLISGLTSVWLPCVVGSQPHLFLTSAMLSMTNKICLLVLAVLLEHSGSIHTNVFLLWCTCTDIALKRQNWWGKASLICTEWRDQKFHRRPIPRLFFETKYFWDRYRDFFLRPNVFETDTETFFWDQMFSRPIPRLFWDQIFRDWYRDFCKS